MRGKHWNFIFASTDEHDLVDDLFVCCIRECIFPEYTSRENVNIEIVSHFHLYDG